MRRPDVVLRPLRAREYPEFEERAVEMYAEQSVQAGRVAAAGALEWARRETRKLLTEGIHTPNHLFHVVEQPGPETVGYLWWGYEPRADERAFLYTLLVLPAFRGRGIGGRALELLDGELRARGIQSIGLHVYAFNERAVRLYRRLGYQDISLIMRKNLSGKS